MLKKFCWGHAMHAWAIHCQKSGFLNRLFFLFSVLCTGIMLALPDSVFAQTYAYRSEPFAYDTPSGSAATVAWHTSSPSPACTGYPNGDDDWADVAFPSGFVFTFGGVAYSQVRVYSNGILAFGNDVSGFHRKYTPQALPATAGSTYSGCPTANPVRIMLAYWIDIVAGTANSTAGASVRYELLGTAPNRRFVISFVNVKLYNQTARYNFQIVLRESSSGTNGEFSYRYTSGSSNGLNATVGVQLDSSDFTEFSFNQAFIDTSTGTAIRWYPTSVSPSQVGEYRLDESVGWSSPPSPEEVVIDSSGADRQGRRVASGSGIPYPLSLPVARVCAGANINLNSSNAEISAIDLGQGPSDVGNAGSLTFWYRNNAQWSANTTRTLFDSTTQASRPFFLSKVRSGSNSILRFALTDSSGDVQTLNTGTQNHAANTWVHVGVSWFLRAGSNQSVMQIFVNGQRAAFMRFTSSGALHGSLSSIYFGDNRTSGVTPSNGSPNSADGAFDEIRVYDFDISPPQALRDMGISRSNCSPLNHFQIDHAGTGNTCQPVSVTFSAHDMNHYPVTLVGSSMSITATSGNGSWEAQSATGTLTDLGSGSATYVWNGESEIVLRYRGTVTGTVNFNVNSGGVRENSGSAGGGHDPDLVLTGCLSGFNACEVSTPRCVPTVPPAMSYGALYTKLVGTVFNLDGVALKDDGLLESGFSGEVSVDLLANHSTGVVLGTDNCPVSQDAVINAGTVQFADGRAVVTGVNVNSAYRDVRVRFSCSTAVCGEAKTFCSLDNFAIRPSGFSSVISTHANADTAGASATNTPVVKAGADFSLSASSVAGYNRQPKIDQDKVQPHSGGVSGSVGGAFGNADPVTGVATGATFNYSEVGYFRFDAYGVYDDDFAQVDIDQGHCTNDFSNVAMGGRYGCKFGNTVATDYFGRFIPDRFGLVTGALTNRYALACSPASSFTYVGEPFATEFVLRALNVAGATTVNYAGGHAKFDLGSWAGFNFLGNAGVLVAADPPAGSWVSGEAAVSAHHAVSRPASPVSPYLSYQVSALPSYADGGETVALQSRSVVHTGSTEIRFGRLRLSNTFGSEKSALKVPVEAQYWGNQSWIKNDADSCTSFAASAMAVTKTPLSLSTTPGALAALSGGSGWITLSAPGAGNVGRVRLCLDLGSDNGVSCDAVSAGAPWLQSRWTQGGAFNNDPSAIATFGIYEAERRKAVHVRELF